MWWVKRNLPATEYALWGAEFALRAEDAQQHNMSAQVGRKL